MHTAENHRPPRVVRAPNGRVVRMGHPGQLVARPGWPPGRVGANRPEDAGRHHGVRLRRPDQRRLVRARPGRVRHVVLARRRRSRPARRQRQLLRRRLADRSVRRKRPQAVRRPAGGRQRARDRPRNRPRRDSGVVRARPDGPAGGHGERGVPGRGVHLEPFPRPSLRRAASCSRAGRVLVCSASGSW